MGNNAIIITFDEGNNATSRVLTVVVTSHGPRHFQDNTAYNHYSLLASLQQTFGAGCLLNSCTANPMTKLFSISGSTAVAKCPRPSTFLQARTPIFPQGSGKRAAPVSLTGSGWSIVPSYSFGLQDNVLASVSAISADRRLGGRRLLSDRVASAGHAGTPLRRNRWTAFPLPNVGTEQNVLQGVSLTSTGLAWAVGFYESGKFRQNTLIEHFGGAVWSVVPSPSPGARQSVLYGVAAISDHDVWAVGAEEDSPDCGTHSPSIGTGRVVGGRALDPGASGNQLVLGEGHSDRTMLCCGTAGRSRFPSGALIERWDGKSWSLMGAPSDPSASALPLGVIGTATSLTIVGQQETDTAPYTTYVAAGAPGSLSLQTTPNAGDGENDLFAVTIAEDGTTWAVGWDIHPATDTHDPLVLQGVNGAWSVVPSPKFAAGSDSGFAAITAIPGGGLWAVGVTATSTSNYSTLIE